MAAARDGRSACLRRHSSMSLRNEAGTRISNRSVLTEAATNNTTELTLRLTLQKAGLRLRSSGVSYEIFHGGQLVLSGNAHGESLSIDDVANFCRRALIR
jgi:hypothetical protein